MGKLYADAINQSARFVTDPTVTDYVNRVGQKIVVNSDCKMPFTIRVIDSPQINAFSLPGGYLYVYAGLIQNAANEAELAGVMAHEIAHVCAHHAAREMTRLNYAQFGAIPLVMAGGWSGVALAGGADVAVPAAYVRFSRAFEAEADYLGVQYMYLAGYDPQALIAYFERVQALAASKPGAIAREFAGHSATSERIARIRSEIVRILPPREEHPVDAVELDAVKMRLAKIEKQRREGVEEH
jgi:predicted Zn-dependent protease